MNDNNKPEQPVSTENPSVSTSGDTGTQVTDPKSKKAPTKKEKLVKAGLAVLVIVIILLLFSNVVLPRRDYKKAISSYNSVVTQYNKLIEDRESLVKDVKGKNDDLEKAIAEAQESASSGLAPADDSTLTALQQAIQQAKSTEYDFSSETSFDKEKQKTRDENYAEYFRNELSQKTTEIENEKLDLEEKKDALETNIEDLKKVDYTENITDLNNTKNAYDESVRALSRKEISVTSPASSYKDKKYDTVQKELETLGFRNITLSPVNDISGARDRSLNNVISVSINGNDAFKEKDTFVASDQVIISYHSNAPAEQNATDPTLNEKTVEMPASFKKMKKRNYEDVQTDLQDAGLKDIKLVGLDKSFFLTKSGEVQCITVNGDDQFAKGDDVTNALVRIYYAADEDELSEEDERIVQCLDHVENSNIPVNVPFRSKDAKGKSYKQIVLQLYDAGFRNIILDPQESKGIAFWHGNGEVESITIQGQDSFDKNDPFKQGTPVRIKYYKK